MSEGSKEVAEKGSENGAAVAPASLRVAERGLRSSVDFRDFMSGLMSDVISGRVNPGVANAACNAGGKLLKMVELEMRYAQSPERPRGVISVAFDEKERATSVAITG